MSLSTGQFGRRIDFAGKPNLGGPYAITNDGLTAWFAFSGGPSLNAIDLSSGKYRGAANYLPNGQSEVSSLLLSPDQRTVWIVVRDADELLGVDLASGHITSTIPLQSAGLLALSPDGKTAYVTGGSDGNGSEPTTDILSVVDLTSRTVRSVIPIPAGATWVAVTPNGQWAYITNVINSSGDLQSGSITPVDLVHDTAETPIEVKGDTANAVAISPDARIAVVATQSSGLDLISTTSNTLIGSISTPPEPLAFAFSLDGKTLWAATHGGQILKVDVATMKVVAEYGPPRDIPFSSPLGAEPFAIEIPGDPYFTQLSFVGP